jgi:hypothetical protein
MRSSLLPYRFAAILEPFTQFALKPVGPFGVVPDNLYEVVEELAIDIHTRNLNVRKRAGCRCCKPAATRSNERFNSSLG